MSSKLDYLKKYMSAPSASNPADGEKKKRKKKRPKAHASTIRIIDGDAGIHDVEKATKRAREEEEDRAVVLDARGREVDAGALDTAEKCQTEDLCQWNNTPSPHVAPGMAGNLTNLPLELDMATGAFPTVEAAQAACTARGSPAAARASGSNSARVSLSDRTSDCT